MGKFDGKVVLVTGASSGIGAATAIAFANEGAKVVITGRNKERLAETAKKCRSIKGCQVLQVIADLSDFDNLEPLIDRAISKYGAIDILVNNAGYGIFAPINSLTQEQYDGLFQANLRAPFFLSKYALPHLKKTKGCILNVSSVASTTNSIGMSPYAATKAALDHFTHNLATECVESGVRVNAINPAMVATRFADAIDLPDEVKKAILEKYEKRQPLGVIQPEEVSESILFLASASKITGITLVIDGGSLIKGH